ncbi:hypothetical protein [Natronococcus sp.]|uniref:hypothetical protein n=1 Tax=Natronococcus sp. TaxID=35747 RepID=UPI003A4DA6CC
MERRAAGLRRWTRRFLLAGGLALVAFLLALLVDGGRRLAVLLGLYGFVCSTIFGMGYLLLPAYAGRTLVDRRLAGVHFVLAVLGISLLGGGWIREGVGTLFTVGAVLWALGVATFVGSLLATVGPVVLADPTGVLRLGDRSQRSSKLGTVVIPVALGYLLVGTVGLLAATPVLGGWTPTLAQVSHYYAIGFGALLVYALGARLLVGFYHVTPPRSLVYPTLLFGAFAPALLGTFRRGEPWFLPGAAFAALAMTCYLLAVGFVAIETDRSRLELSGIGCGALAGVLAVATALTVVVGENAGIATATTLHWTLVLGGFFPLTIVGYVFQFFPVTGAQVPGATERGVAATIGLLAVGVAVQGVGVGGQLGAVRTVGIGFSLVGAVGYLYLLGGRFAS